MKYLEITVKSLVGEWEEAASWDGYIHKIENRVCEKEVTFCRSIVRYSLAFSVFADVCAVSVSTDKKVSK